jgi:hypothetical protein
MNALVLLKWLAIIGIVAIALCCWGCSLQYRYPDIIGEQPNIGGIGE